MIELKFTVDEINLILNALAARPYFEVAELIEKIKAEGEKQIATVINEGGETKWQK